ncbi:hypothetical protein PVAND_006212 [Polypedilum vanderplanki]|uniref:Uncharacterized protein n=1 Tax=Polypedilum vanderplanki TaxID=319348 RepID=A0A9J6C3H6_POLVA|nr:hypothetical protein PVAND_006212 [Polypedilum vanderplanki]
MKCFLICLLLVGNSLAAPKTKRDSGFFGQFQLPELQIAGVHSGGFGYINHEDAGHGILRTEHHENLDHHGQDHHGSVLHEEYGVPHEEYGVPHEEYGPPQLRELPTTTTPHYCPEEDFQAKFVAVPPVIPTYPLPEIPIIPKQEVLVPHEEYGPPHEECGVPTTTLPPTTTTLPPPTARNYPYAAPTTVPPPPPPPIVPIIVPIAKEYPYPAPTTTPEPTTTTTTTSQAPTPKSAPYPYPSKIKSSYGGHAGVIAKELKVETTEAPKEVHHHAVHSPVIRFVEPKLVIHKKVITFPLLKKKIAAKFAKLY